MRRSWSAVNVAILAGALLVGSWAGAQTGKPSLPKTQRVQVVSPGKDTPVAPVLSEDGKHLYYIKELNTAGDEISQAVFHFQLVDGSLRLKEVVEVDTRFDGLRVSVESARP